MPFDANGNYSLPLGYRAVAGELILPSNHNPPLEDIGSALSNVLVRDGRATATGNWNMGGNRITNLGEGSNPNDAATVGQSSSSIGDFRETLRTLDSKWLRRNGGIYAIADYPDLAALLPPLPDGVTWRLLSTSITQNIRAICQIPDGFMLVETTGGGNDTTIHKSTDGESWSPIAVISSFVAINVIYTGGLYFACGLNAAATAGQVSVSLDGITWSSPISIIAAAAYVVDIAHDGTNFIAVGNVGNIRKSADGSTWTTVTSGTTANLQKVIHDGSEFVAVGSGGAIRTSADGDTWAARTSGTATQFNSLVYTGTIYVAVGNAGIIYTSADKVSWTPRSSGTANNLNSVTYSTSGFMAVGQSGAAVISAAGTSWATTATGQAIALNSVVHDEDMPQRYIVGGLSGTLLEGIRTLPTQFRVPNDDPTYGWVRAVA